MSLLHAFVETPLAASLGWTLLHSLWQGAILSAALSALLLATRSPRIRYTAACACLLILCAAFIITLIHEWSDTAAALRLTHPLHEPAWNAPPFFLPASFAWRPSLTAIAPWLAPFWILGVLTFSVRHIAAFAAVRRLRQRGVCAASTRWQHQLARLCSRLRIRRQVALLESCLADSPVVIGYLRPLILLPVGLLTNFPAAQIEAILLHELAHIRRHDYLINALQRVIEALLFYHPGSWWISHVIRVEREHCCDDDVIAFNQDPEQYAFALAAVEQNRRPVYDPVLAATGGNLMKRIRRILYPQRPTAAFAHISATALVLMTAALALGAWRAASPGNSPAAKPNQNPQTQANLPEKYSKWLNEEVAYIIGDRERAAFEKLSTDEERDQFIEQFWERRNPTPGSAENAFKEEHYRRIAYANRRFQTASGRPGWQTDRGHMYIIYGPPDEIDSHPNGSPAPHPFEVWVYHHVPGSGDYLSFTFIAIDPGDLRLAPEASNSSSRQ